MAAYKLIEGLKTASASTSNVGELKTKVYEAMNDDLNTSVAISHLFEGVRIINSVNDGKETITEADKQALQTLFTQMIFDVFGLKEEAAADTAKMDALMQVVLQIRAEAKAKKDFAASDKLRDDLLNAGIQVKDGKDGASWSFVG